MDFFGLFGKNNDKIKDESEDARRRALLNDSLSGSPASSAPPMNIFSPTSFNDVETIIDSLKSGKPCIVHFNELSEKTCVRVFDMLSGAIYALNGGVYEMEKSVFMFSPSGIEIK